MNRVARDRLPAVATPLLQRLRHGRDVTYKMECDQPTGSFKIRGIGYACAVHAQRGSPGFVASSGGNAGLAVAYAAARLDLPAEVFVPSTTGERMRRLLTDAGATVSVRGDVWDETDVAAREYAASKGLTYIHPFDDPLLWHGHADIVVEAAGQGADPDAVIVSVGGGGLLLGVLQGLDHAGWERLPVIAVETEGAASLQAALDAGRVVALERIESVAHSLGARRVAEECLRQAQKNDVRSVTVTDGQALDACRWFYREEDRLVEPACGAALAALSEPSATEFIRPLVIVCGGSGTTAADLEA